MLKLDREALICDLAETYSIYNYLDFPPTKIAIYAKGLRDNSRIKMIVNNQMVSNDTLLLAGILDRLSLLVWFKTKDGQKGKGKPVMISKMFTDKASKSVLSFASGEEFEKIRSKLLGGE